MEEQVSKVEGQVQALSDAIIVIAEPWGVVDAVDAALKTVKDKM